MMGGVPEGIAIGGDAGGVMGAIGSSLPGGASVVLFCVTWASSVSPYVFEKKRNTPTNRAKAAATIAAAAPVLHFSFSEFAIFNNLHG